MLSFGTVKRAVLELISQDTIAGEAVPPSYNNQADCIRKIPGLVNQAILKIRTACPDRRMADLWEGERQGKWLRCPLPADCKSLISGGVWRYGPDGPEPVSRFRLAGRFLFLPASDGLASGGPVSEAAVSCGPASDGPQTGGYFVEYNAWPVQLPPDPHDGFLLDETPEAIQAAEYYAAAQLVMMEDEFSYAALMNEFESRLAAMAPPVTAELRPMRNVYGTPQAFM